MPARLPGFFLACFVSMPCASATPGDADGFDGANLRGFIRSMVQEHGFQDSALRRLFALARLEPAILEAIEKPAEAKPWYQYRPIFLNPERISAGIGFWRDNAMRLKDAWGAYGVDPAIIVAILGVETFYGRNPGRHRVIDALATLAFNYPKRAPFFLSELEHFLLLTRDQGVDPLSLTGSYAGAMGLPQFMPSSFRAYAVDFDADGATDIWSNPADAIGSVGNYLQRHGWNRDAPVAVPAAVAGDGYQRLLAADIQPTLDVMQVEQAGVRPQAALAPGTKIAVIELESQGAREYWLGCNNFYVITRYNHSPLYAMAVHQLAEAIRTGYSELQAAMP
ncbi:MAG: lytic murein transglycosylase B [Chromatiales bacterium]